MDEKLNPIAIFDIDGVLTDGGFYNTKEGKFLKKFGADDFDALRELQKYIPAHFITADKKGFPIVVKRIEDEMGFKLDLVSHKPKERWNWIKEKYPNNYIIYVGDGIYDYWPLINSNLGITTSEALFHTQESADVVIDRKGGNRFAAEACLVILKHLWPDFDFYSLGQEDHE